MSVEQFDLNKAKEEFEKALQNPECVSRLKRAAKKTAKLGAPESLNGVNGTHEGGKNGVHPKDEKEQK